MSEFKGTKGNWSVRDNATVINESNRTGIIGTKGKEPFMVCILTECKQKKANAKLIAAAPELLEALIEVVRISDRNNIAWNRAKEAIKKATE